MDTNSKSRLITAIFTSMLLCLTTIGATANTDSRKMTSMAAFANDVNNPTDTSKTIANDVNNSTDTSKTIANDVNNSTDTSKTIANDVNNSTDTSKTIANDVNNSTDDDMINTAIIRNYNDGSFEFHYWSRVAWPMYNYPDFGSGLSGWICKENESKVWRAEATDRFGWYRIVALNGSNTSVEGYSFISQLAKEWFGMLNMPMLVVRYAYNAPLPTNQYPGILNVKKDDVFLIVDEGNSDMWYRAISIEGKIQKIFLNDQNWSFFKKEEMTIESFLKEASRRMSDGTANTPKATTTAFNVTTASTTTATSNVTTTTTAIGNITTEDQMSTNLPSYDEITYWVFFPENASETFTVMGYNGCSVYEMNSGEVLECHGFTSSRRALIGVYTDTGGYEEGNIELDKRFKQISKQQYLWVLNGGQLKPSDIQPPSTMTPTTPTPTKPKTTYYFKYVGDGLPWNVREKESEYSKSLAEVKTDDVIAITGAWATWSPCFEFCKDDGYTVTEGYAQIWPYVGREDEPGKFFVPITREEYLKATNQNLY